MLSAMLFNDTRCDRLNNLKPYAFRVCKFLFPIFVFIFKTLYKLLNRIGKYYDDGLLKFLINNFHI